MLRVVSKRLDQIRLSGRRISRDEGGRARPPRFSEKRSQPTTHERKVMNELIAKNREQNNAVAVEREKIKQRLRHMLRKERRLNDAQRRVGQRVDWDGFTLSDDLVCIFDLCL